MPLSLICTKANHLLLAIVGISIVKEAWLSLFWIQFQQVIRNVHYVETFIVVLSFQLSQSFMALVIYAVIGENVVIFDGFRGCTMLLRRHMLVHPHHQRSTISYDDIIWRWNSTWRGTNKLLLLRMMLRTDFNLLYASRLVNTAFTIVIAHSDWTRRSRDNVLLLFSYDLLVLLILLTPMVDTSKMVGRLLLIMRLLLPTCYLLR